MLAPFVSPALLCVSIAAPTLLAGTGFPAPRGFSLITLLVLCACGSTTPLHACNDISKGPLHVSAAPACSPLRWICEQLLNPKRRRQEAPNACTLGNGRNIMRRHLRCFLPGLHSPRGTSLRQLLDDDAPLSLSLLADPPANTALLCWALEEASYRTREPPRATATSFWHRRIS